MKSYTKTAAVALPAAAALVAAALVPSTSATADPVAAASSATSSASVRAAAPAAPAFFQAATARDLPTTGADAVKGTRRLVTLDPSLLPRPGTSRDLGLPVDAGSPLVARVDQVTEQDGFTSWTGSTLDTLGYFSLVEADGVYRGRVATVDGTTSITSAGGDRYWLTDVAPYPTPTEDDVVHFPADEASGASGADAAGPTTAALTDRAGKKGKKGKKGKRGKSKVTVLFGYTKDTLLAAGGKAQVKAAAALAVADTNNAMKNSQVKAKVKLKGIVKTKGSESSSMAKDIRRVENPRDGKFDSLIRDRNRKGADIVHLLVTGIDPGLCGIGAQVVSARRANQLFGVSMSALDCIDNFTPAHELGHNMGADHNDYPGVAHYAKAKYAYGYVDLVNRFTTVMSYDVTCYDQGFNCLRAPFYSSNKALFNGVPVGNKSMNNAKVLNSVIPRVARYRR